MLLWTEGYELCSVAADVQTYKDLYWPIAFGGSWIVGYTGVVAGRVSGYGFRPSTQNNGGTTYLYQWLDGGVHTTNASNEGVFGFAFYLTEDYNYTSDYRWITVNSADNTGAQFRLDLNAASKLELRDGGGTLLLTADWVFPYLQWYYLEIKFKIHPVSGYVEVYLNDELFLSKYNFNTNYRNAVNLYPGHIYWMSPKRSMTYDDMYYLDTTGDAPFNNRLGPIALTAVFPTAAGTKAEWAMRAGGTEHYLEVDDPYVVDTDATYIQTATPNTVEWFKFPAQAGLIPLAVQVDAVAKLMASGTGRLDLGITTTTESATQWKTGGFLRIGAWDCTKKIFQLAPDNTPWTLAKLNATQFGFKNRVGLV